MAAKSIRGIRPYLRERNARGLKARLKALQSKFIQPGTSQRKTGKPDSVQKYGRLFLASFSDRSIPSQTNTRTIPIRVVPSRYEAQVALEIAGPEYKPFWVKLGFNTNTVVVEAIGGEPGAKKAAAELNAELGRPWPNVLLEEIESHARALGFRFVLIRRPETLEWYQHPAPYTIPEEELARFENQAALRVKFLRDRLNLGRFPRVMQKGTLALTAEFGESLGIRNGKFFRIPKPSEWGMIESGINHILIVNYIRSNMKHFYYRVAQQNGYKKKGDFFVKRL